MDQKKVCIVWKKELKLTLEQLQEKCRYYDISNKRLNKSENVYYCQGELNHLNKISEEINKCIHMYKK